MRDITLRLQRLDGKAILSLGHPAAFKDYQAVKSEPIVQIQDIVVGEASAANVEKSVACLDVISEYERGYCELVAGSTDTRPGHCASSFGS